ncbi:methyltransferase [Chelativorans sp. AA-79]|uniref:methyltransferase n=1 Tax=Chelativorans sp. AA-79 TaxID=3028735 RepID=UPI003211D1BE
MDQQTVWEPACNRGYMVKPLREYFGIVIASDVHDYGHGHVVRDFLFPGDIRNVDWIVTNPPFRLARQFIARSSQLARIGFAMIVRSAFLEGTGRYEGLFSKNPPSIIAQFTERVIMTKGIVRDPAKLYWDEKAQKWKRPSTATAYTWLVWIDGQSDTRFMWIPPCRRKLERPNDYSEST